MPKKHLKGIFKISCQFDWCKHDKVTKCSWFYYLVLKTSAWSALKVNVKQENLLRRTIIYDREVLAYQFVFVSLVLWRSQKLQLCDVTIGTVSFRQQLIDDCLTSRFRFVMGYVMNTWYARQNPKIDAVYGLGQWYLHLQM